MLFFFSPPLPFFVQLAVQKQVLILLSFITQLLPVFLVVSPCCLKQLRHKLFPLVVLVNWALNSAVLQCTRRCIFLRPFLFSITYLVCCIIILVPLTKYVSITLLILVLPLVFTLFGCAIVCKFLPGALCCTGCRPSSHTTVHIGFHSVANCTVSSSSFFVFSAMKQ